MPGLVMDSLGGMLNADELYFLKYVVGASFYQEVKVHTDRFNDKSK